MGMDRPCATPDRACQFLSPVLSAGREDLPNRGEALDVFRRQYGGIWNSERVSRRTAGCCLHLVNIAALEMGCVRY